MGGRGSSSGTGGVRSQLKSMAARGVMPAFIGGNKEQQSFVFKEISKAYKMPDTSGTKIVDQGDKVWIQIGNKVVGSSYPSGTKASNQEKDGVIKFVLYNEKKKKR